VEDADAIFSVQGIDAIFVGPTTWREHAEQGRQTTQRGGYFPGDEAHPGDVPQAPRAAGLHCGNAEEARHRIEEGWQFIASAVSCG